jgi:hypothetical protein
MSDKDAPIDSQSAPSDPCVPSGGKVTEEGLAVLLLRLLGVYFAVYGIIGVVKELVSMILLTNKYPLEMILAKEWTSMLRPVLEASVGLYFLLGGQWVFEKLLMPFVRCQMDETTKEDEN